MIELLERGAHRYLRQTPDDCEEDRTLRGVLVGILREGRPATAPSGMQAPNASDDQEGRGSWACF